MIKLVAFTLLLVATLTWNFKSNPFRVSEELTYSNQQVQYFDQILDHYSYLPPKFWKQRYFVDDSSFSSHDGPIVLVLCGEGPCGGLPDGYWISTIA